VITFLHTADWQIGKPFASIADPAKRARVQQERIEAIRRIGDVVRERRAAFVVVAGDLFDSPTPTNSTIAAALGAIASLEVPVYCIPGNHDHGGPDSLWEQPFFKSEHQRLAANFHLLLEPGPVVVDVAGGDGGPTSVVLLSCPLRRRHEAEDPTAWIRGLDFVPFDDRPRIVIAHGSTTVFAPGGSGGAPGAFVGPGSTSQADDEEPAAGGINTLALDRLPLPEIDYLALGDWHGFLAAGPKAFYSGAPEIDRFPKPGQRPGHVAVVTVARGAEPRVESVITGRFRWLVHAAALGDDGPKQLDDWLAEATRPAAAGAAGFDTCLARLEVSGSVSLAERAALDQIVESWTARLLRLDLDDQTVLAPSADEIRELAERPGDPIIARVAAELVVMLEASSGATGILPAESGLPAPDVVRRAIHILHALVTAADADLPEPPRALAEPAAAAPATISAEETTP
jgi:DNA repair exonuclease SbcCD nuclease subunit